MIYRQLKSAFTLVEVLVVVAIIAILISILIPSMLYVRKQARKASLEAQMSRLHQSFEHYTSEYGAAPSIYTHEELSDVHEDITQTENAFFAMQGGLVYDSSGDPPDLTTLANDVRNEDGGNSYDPGSYGTGAMYKDPSGSANKQGAFYRTQESEVQFVKGTTGADNFIPDIVDPVNGQPILVYLTSPHPKDSKGYARKDGNVRPVSYDDSGMGSNSDLYGLVWRRLNEDFFASEGLGSGGGTIDQKMNSLISDAAVIREDGGLDQNSTMGANSNLAWYIKDWTQVNSSTASTGNPNGHSSRGHMVTKAYFLISAGYDGVYFNQKTNSAHTLDFNYHHGHWEWDSGYTKYSTFQEERDHWFSEKRTDRLIFAHRYYWGTQTGEEHRGRNSSFVGPDGRTGGKDGAYGKRKNQVLMEFDDIVKSGGEYDASVE